MEPKPEYTKDHLKFDKDIVDYFPEPSPKYQPSIVIDPSGEYSIHHAKRDGQCPFCHRQVYIALGTYAKVCDCGAEVEILYEWRKRNLKK